MYFIFFYFYTFVSFVYVIFYEFVQLILKHGMQNTGLTLVKDVKSFI